MTKTKPFLSTSYGDPSATEVPLCCEAATTKLSFSTTSVLLLLNVPLSLSRGTISRRQKNPRRGYRPKIAGILNRKVNTILSADGSVPLNHYRTYRRHWFIQVNSRVGDGVGDRVGDRAGAGESVFAIGFGCCSRVYIL